MSKSNPDPWDLRVRARNLASGVIDGKAVEKYLASLPDMEAQSEKLELPQPALSSSLDDDDDDENGSDGES
jgi:hypothetical protein